MATFLYAFFTALFMLALPIAIAYCIDPNETKKQLQNIIDMIRKYDIQDQMSLFQESMWVEKVIDSCTTYRQLWNAEKLIPFLCTKYKGKVKEIVIKNVRYRLRDIWNIKHRRID